MNAFLGGKGMYQEADHPAQALKSQARDEDGFTVVCGLMRCDRSGKSPGEHNCNKNRQYPRELHENPFDSPGNTGKIHPGVILCTVKRPGFPLNNKRYIPTAIRNVPAQ